MCPPAPSTYRSGVDIVNAFLLTAAASPWMLPVMFAVAVIDAVFPPIPSETILVAAAAALAASAAGGVIPLLCLAAAAGAVLGDNLAYGLGRALGTRRFGWMRQPRVVAALDRAQQALTERGAALIIGARYIPAGRVAVNMAAGALRYRWRTFLPVSVVAGVSWAAYGAGIGVLAGSWVAQQPLVASVIGVALAITIGVTVDQLAAVRRRRARARAAEQAAAAAQTRRVELVPEHC